MSDLRLEDLEPLAQRIAELVAGTVAVREALVDADAVARYLAVDRSWVYEHADELGARRAR